MTNPHKDNPMLRLFAKFLVWLFGKWEKKSGMTWYHGSMYTHEEARKRGWTPDGKT